MTLSHTKRKERRIFRKWHATTGLRACIVCGKHLYNTTHHVYCNQCHKGEYKFWDIQNKVMLYTETELIDALPDVEVIIMKQTAEIDSMGEYIYKHVRVYKHTNYFVPRK